MNKKASIQEFILIMVFLLIISVVTLIMFKVSNSFTDQWQESVPSNLAGAEDSTKNLRRVNNLYPGIIDNSFLLLTIGLSIGAFILAAMVRVHPAFLAIFILVLALIIFFGAVFSNIYQEIANEPEMIDLANKLKFISTIMNILPFIVGIFGGILAIVMYKTWQGEQYV